MTFTHKGPTAPANRSGAPGLHQASDGRWLLQTFLWPSQILWPSGYRSSFARFCGRR